MWHKFLRDASFFELLYELDEDIAAQVRAAGCQHCGGRLDAAHYPRKPRGGPADLDKRFAGRRLSFCCRREGCRGRATPPSVRFLGRRVYWGVVVVLAAALQQGVTTFRAERLRRRLGIDSKTLERWRQWWVTRFPTTRFWQAARGRFVPPVDANALPLSLLERFDVDHCGDSGDERRQMVRLLCFLSPTTTQSATVGVSDGG